MNSEQSRPAQSKPNDGTKQRKKAYRKPEFSRLGTIAEMSRGGSTMGLEATVHGRT